ncbi:GNAT family N-acetyltransferase [Gallaecimonas xiamenensis]|uniref:GNAT family N-acetyltransferase n=1 Tax=Gallaecimonas xiamenensis 3-C-1 TaxID=745411 RepID=K2JP08_9GAMM|nr:GNAT family N-acetyltransferase [Gallaecimonas xiamenensis]EKE76257.1 hypothetical protein B3C1_05095 [Gallaecimonas xiamenensis 3-C-1]
MVSIRFLSAIAQVPAAHWDALAQDHPFVRHGFLAALEQSGAVGRGSGWQPQHLVLYEGDTLLAAMPLYLKQHSFGEYVFDQGWAQAYERHGLSYYPKLVAAVPFTPVTGPRLMLAKGAGQERVAEVFAALIKHCQALGASSWHLLFPSPLQLAQLKDAMPDLAARQGVQFHWHNKGYGDFSDFLATFKARKRKTVTKERQQAQQGLTFKRLLGPEISEALWQRFYLFYRGTYLKRSGHGGYLPASFFPLLGQALGEQLLMVGAFAGEELVAASLFFKDGQCLYGRYWGCLEERDALHFECCYYQGIDYCIDRGLARFDAGAQGEHKLARGFEPVVTWSLHWLEEPAFAEAVAHFVQEEAQMLAQYRKEAAQRLPFHAI